MVMSASKLPALNRDDLPPMMSLRQYAAYTGCSYDTIKDQARQGTLPAPVVRLGRRYFVKRDELLSQLDGTDAIAKELAGVKRELAALRRSLGRVFGAAALDAAD
jgi:excisionase family DNA binding protein